MHEHIYNFFQDLNTTYDPETISAEYAKGEPTPFYMIDNFLPPWLYNTIINSFEDIPEERYKIFANQYSERRECRNFAEAPLLQTLANSFNSKLFVDWLEVCTGTKSLVPDPHFLGGGFCRSSRNTSLGLHTDFNWNNGLKLNRQKNAILYLNKDWKEEWNGHLEFWNNERTECVKKIAPKPNRLIFWDYGYDLVHGHPEPIECPQAITRDSLILFYYTSNATYEHDPRRSQFYEQAD